MRGCCDTGPCMTHLAERGADYSTLLSRGVIVCVPNYAAQELVGAFSRAVIA